MNSRNRRKLAFRMKGTKLGTLRTTKIPEYGDYGDYTNLTQNNKGDNFKDKSRKLNMKNNHYHSYPTKNGIKYNGTHASRTGKHVFTKKSH